MMEEGAPKLVSPHQEDVRLAADAGGLVLPTDEDPHAARRRKRQAQNFGKTPLAGMRPATIGDQSSAVGARIIPRRPSKSIGPVSAMQELEGHKELKQTPPGCASFKLSAQRFAKAQEETTKGVEIQEEKRESLEKKGDKEKLAKVRKDSKEREKMDKKKRKEEKKREREEREREKQTNKDKPKEQVIAPAGSSPKIEGDGALTFRESFAARKGSLSADDVPSVINKKSAGSESGSATLKRTKSSSNNTSQSLSAREMRAGTFGRPEVRRKQLQERSDKGSIVESTEESQQEPLLLSRFVIAFLIDAFVRLQGNEMEGVFRIPGDADEVSRTMERLKRGDFTLTTTDPYIVASVLLSWLLQLPEPLIPFSYYDACIEIATKRGLSENGSGAKEEFKLVARLPEKNKNVIFDILNFIGEMVKPQTTSKTSMTLASLASVFQPVFLRSRDSMMLFLNSAYEVSFVKNLFSTYLTLSKVERQITGS